MNKIIILLSLIVLAACTPLMSTQSVNDIAAKQNASAPAKITAPPGMIAKIICTCPSGYVLDGNSCNPACYYGTPRCAAPSFICNNTKTTFVENTSSTDNLKNATSKQVTVVAVTEDQGGCLLRVGSVTDLVLVGETKIVNGVKIHVLDAHTFHSFAQNDICQMIIS